MAPISLKKLCSFHYANATGILLQAIGLFTVPGAILESKPPKHHLEARVESHFVSGVCLTKNLPSSLLFFRICPVFSRYFSIMNSSNTHQDTPPSTSKKRGKQCAVYGCHNYYYNDKGLSAGYHFFSFPTDPKTRNHRCNLIKRQHGKDDFNVTAATIVCSEHFRQEDIIRKLSGRWDLKKGM